MSFFITISRKWKHLRLLYISKLNKQRDFNFCQEYFRTVILFLKLRRLRLHRRNVVQVTLITTCPEHEDSLSWLSSLFKQLARKLYGRIGRGKLTAYIYHPFPSSSSLVKYFGGARCYKFSIIKFASTRS